MDEPPLAPRNLLPVAIFFEGLLGLVAVGLGALLGYPLGPMIQWSWSAIGWGALASLPLVAFLGVLVGYPFWPFRDLLRVVDELLVPIFRRAGLGELALISLVAGLGEEALFRGLIQTALSDRIGGPAGLWVGLAVASLLFGLAHFLTYSYVVMATLMGLYLGWLWIEYGNLLVPITAHALYDFLALAYLAKIRGQRSGGP